MRSSLFLSLLVLAGIPVFTAGTASALPVPPVLIDSGLDFIRSDRNQKYPSAAFDGSNWLVVWQDERGDREAVWCARVSSAGVLLDSANFCVADDAEERTTPRVAFNGTCYLVVWQDGRGASYDIYGARVTPAGAILDPNGFLISRSPETDEYPAVASNGSDFLVVWQDDRNPGSDRDIYAARVTGGGQVLDTVNVAVSTAPMPQEYPAVRACGSAYLVVWQDQRNDTTTADDVYACRVTATGSALDPAGIPVTRAAHSQYNQMLATDGTNWLVVWEDNRNGNGDIYGARVSQSGGVLDPAGLPLATLGNSWQGEPDVSFDGTRYVVTWADDSLSGGFINNILAARVATSGQVIDPEGIAVTTPFLGTQEWPILALGSSNLFVAWQDWRDGDPDIYANRLSLGCARLDTADALVSRVLYPYEQASPAAAFDGTNFLTVWHDSRAPLTTDKLYGARITQAGTLLDPGGLRIGEFNYSIGAPALAFGGSNYLVCWDGGGGGYSANAARITRAGVPLDSNSIYTGIIGQSGGPTAVAFDGTNWFVVAAFQDWGGLANVQGVRISPEGALLDSHAIRLAYIPRGLEAPAVAFGATSYLVAWQDFRSGSTYDIYGALVSTDGTILDSGIAISTAAGSQRVPSVAFDGTNWLVVWQDGRDGGDDDYYFTRVSQSGTVLDPGGIRLGWCPDNYEDACQLVFDGANYFAVWQWRNYSNGDLWGARISPSGVVLDTFPVCTAPEYQATPAIARATGGQFIVSYSGWVPTLHGYPAEKMRIWAGIYPFNSVAEDLPASVRADVPAATIVRGVLAIPQSAFRNPHSAIALLDIAGRKVMNLKPGANDVSQLAPGVYFMSERSADNGQRSAIRKVVIQQ